VKVARTIHLCLGRGARGGCLACPTDAPGTESSDPRKQGKPTSCETLHRSIHTGNEVARVPAARRRPSASLPAPSTALKPGLGRGPFLLSSEREGEDPVGRFLSDGAPLEWVREQMGHTEIDTTRKHYARWQRESEYAILDQLNATRSKPGQKADTKAAVAE
jgi:hypothetical protein